MAEKKTKCSTCAKRAAAVTARAAKVPNKRETVKLAGAARRAQAAYTSAVVALVDALLAREAIKAKSPIVTKFAKASALENEALEKIGELGY